MHSESPSALLNWDAEKLRSPEAPARCEACGAKLNSHNQTRWCSPCRDKEWKGRVLKSAPACAEAHLESEI